MQIGFVGQGRTVACGEAVGRFLRMSGPDALVELRDGRRVMWSAATDVEVLEDHEELEVNVLPRLEAELARLEGFTVGKYAELGVQVSTPCAEVPKYMHEAFVAALGDRPSDAILCRRCSTKLCIRMDHLFWGTRSDCQRDMILRGVARPRGKTVTLEEVVLRRAKLRLKIRRLKTFVSDVSDGL